MREPLVVAVMLVNGRPEMVKRAIRSFEAQAYERIRLLVWDTGDPRLTPYESNRIYWPEVFTGQKWEVGALRNPRIYWPKVATGQKWEVGALRNHVVKYAYGIFGTLPEFFCHFDSDDWSHPRRIEEQVALLESTGADAVGYSDCLFWDSRRAQIEVHPDVPAPDGGKGCLGIVKSVGEAWFYRAEPFMLGGVVPASLMYRRSTWERWPFLADTSQGEEHRLITECNGCWVSSTSTMKAVEPRMVCQIHSHNTSNAYNRDKMEMAREWRRMFQWDARLAEIMKL